MKITTFVCAVTVAGALFTSCKKNNDSTPQPPAAGQDSARVTYRVVSTRTDTGLIRFTAVTGAGKQVAFKGNKPERIEIYKLNFSPSNFMTAGYDLTSITIPPGTYSNAEFNYQMIPSRDPALKLVGTWNSGGTSVPVEVNMDQFVEIATKLPTVTLEANKNYTALIKLDLAQAQNGIFASNLTNATRTNGKIVISSFSNSNLLQTFLNNINNVIQHEVTVTAQ